MSVAKAKDISDASNRAWARKLHSQLAQCSPPFMTGLVSACTGKCKKINHQTTVYVRGLLLRWLYRVGALRWRVRDVNWVPCQNSDAEAEKPWLIGKIEYLPALKELINLCRLESLGVERYRT